MRNGRRRRREEPEAGSPLWMTTYGDMMTLLMCFFVALFAFSRIDVARFQEAILSIQGALGVLTGGPRPFNPSEIPVSTGLSRAEQEKAEVRKSQLRGILNRLQGYFRERGFAGSVQMDISERGLTVSFMDRVLFKIGDAELLAQAAGILHEVGGVLQGIPNDVRIEGHTCDLPIHTPQYPSNWELSTSRATNVLRFLIEREGLDPKRMSAVGYGEYRPKVPNINEANRARNRRVDIVILPLSDSEVESLVKESAKAGAKEGEKSAGTGEGAQPAR